MARGRKRKTGMRTPNGRLSRSKAAVDQQRQGERATGLAQPHRRMVPETKRGDQRAGTLIGRLYLAGIITEAQCEAGERWAAVMHALHCVLASPSTVGSTIGQMVPSGNEPPAEDDRLSDANVETPQQRQDRLMRSFDKVVGRLDVIEMCALDAVCVQQQMPPSGDGSSGAAREMRAGRLYGDPMDELKSSLDRLVSLWHLGDDEKPREMRGHMMADARPVAEPGVREVVFTYR